MSGIPPLYLLIPFAPLLGSFIAGFGARWIGRAGAHSAAIAGVAVSTVGAWIALFQVIHGLRFDATLYEWSVIEGMRLEVGFLIDSLTATMMVVVTTVSLMVHIYTVGYMRDDPGYARFFSYISLFTFAMLMLVMSNNLLQLFFGWEAVGLVSYLLIGFWYTRPSAIRANLKAFLVNRVGDFGFLLGIALIYAYLGTLHYGDIFASGATLALKTLPGTDWMLITVVCIALFIGAMGKSAQFPLHVWLPDSMEGPTPISALIHAATMVTAGIFMVARMSPLFELSTTALSFMMIVGAITAFFMGLLGIVQNDIKRVVAYSTLSQLGYMTVALGASAYSAAIFHLMTHAFFKALLFLAAGSVIIGMHHEQDIRRMGGLWRKMPLTWFTSLLGSLALIGMPFFSGFYSKETLIEAVGLSTTPGASIAHAALMAGVFITAFYSFRMFFLVFHGKARYGSEPHAPAAHSLAPASVAVVASSLSTSASHAPHHDEAHHDHPASEPHESPWVITAPLIVLAVPSLIAGALLIGPMLFDGWFDGAIRVAPEHGVIAHIAEEFHGAWNLGLHAFTTLPFWLAIAGVVCAAVFYLRQPAWPKALAARLPWLYRLLDQNYYFDRFNEWFFAGGVRRVGQVLWRFGDRTVIDGWLVNGSARVVGQIAAIARHWQSGYIYHYAFAMILGLLGLLALFVTLPS